jgi:hypothetical protein
MAGEIQLNSVTLATESSGLISFGGSVQAVPPTIPNWYLAEQQITGGNDVSAGFYAGSATASERRTVNIPAMQLRINATVYTLSTATTLDADTTGSWASNETSKATAANRNGEDVYIYAVEPSSGTTPNFCLSSNSTYPDGTVGGVTASATNSRKIGGFHCLCVDVGTISGHSLTGYLDGDILPRSVWTQAQHRPTSSPEGMVYVGNKLWADIYLASNTTTLESSYGGTASRRMISNVGCEDCAGVLWQWANETGSDGGAASYAVQDTSSETSSYDGRVGLEINRGQGYSVPNRGLVGGNWSAGAACGSRGVVWNNPPLNLGTDVGSRGVSGSLY